MIISGFLGAGKTTWIRDFLHQYKDLSGVCVIENDFGPLNVDEALLGDSGVAIRSLASGCVCCSIAGSLIRTLEEVKGRLNPELVLIEPSGVVKLSDLKRWLREAGFRVDYTLTLVDGSRWRQNLDNYDGYFEDQVRHADAILVNGWSLESDARDFLREFSGVSIITPTVSWVRAEMIWDGPERSATPLLDAMRAPAHTHGEGAGDSGHDHHDHPHHGDGTDHHEHPDFCSALIRVGREEVDGWLLRFDANRAQLSDSGWMRAKGIIETDKGVRILQWRGESITLDPCSETAAHHAGSVVFIGRQDADRSALSALEG